MYRIAFVFCLKFESLWLEYLYFPKTVKKLLPSHVFRIIWEGMVAGGITINEKEC